MGGFPEDHEIHVSILIKLLVAEGFLKHPDGSKTYEERAEEYLEDLVKRNLVLVSRRKRSGKIKICSIHDLVRDMCVRKALKERFLVHVGSGYALPEIITNQRRLSKFYDNLNCFSSVYSSSVRTILYFPEWATSRGSFEHFRLLRVLYLLNTRQGDPGIDPPHEIFELFHLRFLGLHSCKIVPDAISHLHNLQTFIARSAYFGDLNLPRTIWRMPQLRHLVCRFSWSLYLGDIDDPSRACIDEVLTNLQTFSLVYNLECTGQMLQRIPNLKKLGIYYTSVSCDKDNKLENLVSLHQLEKLTLRFPASHIRSALPDERFQGKFNPVFPTTLRKLTLTGWPLSWKNMTIVGSLPNLEVLKLSDFKGQESTWETSKGEFRCLKYLFVYDTDLEHWITESSHFPSLESLRLYFCWELREIPDCIGEISTLELIEVVNSNKSGLGHTHRRGTTKLRK